jgi:hypothetical protein
MGNFTAVLGVILATRRSGNESNNENAFEMTRRPLLLLFTVIPGIAQPVPSQRLQLRLVPPPPPSYLWKPGIAQPQVTQIALYLADVFSIPGGTYGGLQLLNAQGREVKAWKFQLGWRNRLGQANLTYSIDYRADLLTINTTPVINGRDIAKIYFTLRDQQLHLIRIEDPNGKLVPNHYAYHNYEIGVPPPLADVEPNLHSQHPDEVLSALILLGGIHIDAGSISPYAAEIDRIFTKPAILQQIKTLTNASTPWIREAARQLAK